MFTFAVSRNLMKYAVCTNVIQGERKRIVSATIRLIIHRRTRIIIVQFLRNIARTIVNRAATCHRPVSYLRTCNFFLHCSHEREAYVDRFRVLTALELAANKMHVTYTLTERQVHFTC